MMIPHPTLLTPVQLYIYIYILVSRLRGHDALKLLDSKYTLLFARSHNLHVLLLEYIQLGYSFEQSQSVIERDLSGDEFVTALRNNHLALSNDPVLKSFSIIDSH